MQISNISELIPIDKLSQLEFINRYKSDDQLAIDEWMVGYPLIGQCIALYTYARHTGERQLNLLADEMLDKVLDCTEPIPKLNGEESLCCLGCGLIYLLRNRFVEGDEDEVLAELDSHLTSTLYRSWAKEGKALMGWIHYQVLRADKEVTLSTYYGIRNLIYLLDCLGKGKIADSLLLEDIRKIDVLGIFPERTKYLLSNSVDICFSYKLDKLTDDMVTFAIPFRIDSSARQRNLDILLERLSVRKRTKIILLEADTGSIYRVKKNYPNVYYHFVKDDSSVFHRTKYVNDLLHRAESSIVGIWNTDVLVSDRQIDNAIVDVYEGKAVMSIPGDGRIFTYSVENSFLYRQGFLEPFLCDDEEIISSSIRDMYGDVFFVNKDVYLKIGGDNERLYGVGMDNQERIKRLEILGMPVSWMTGVVFNLTHRHNTSIEFYSQRLELDNIKEYLHICSLTKEAMCDYRYSGNDLSNVYEKKIYLSTNNLNTMKIPLTVPCRSPFLDNYFCLIEEYNLAFVSIAKNAVTHLKNIVVSSKYGFYPDGEEVHDFIGYNDISPYLCPVSKMKERESKSGKLIKFAVWRDPVERLVSCYKHFCLERASHYYFSLLGVYENNSFDYFMSVVRLELSKKDPLYQDEHLRRQSDYYCQEDVDYIVPIHKLNQFLEEQNVPVLKESANETSVRFQLTDPGYIAEIKKLYRSDYEIVITY